MDSELSFLLNNGVAIGVAWYVLTRLNATLKELTNVIAQLNKDIDIRLKNLENNQHYLQIELREVNAKFDTLKRGDNH